MARLILLDRDGVINHDSPDYIKDADEWVPIAGALDAIASLKRAGYLVGVCTNQAGIGRGVFSTDALMRIHDRLHGELARRGVSLDGLRYCPHHPDDGCACRKPRPGMLLDLMESLDVAGSETIFVGDQVKDVEAAIGAGCRPALVRTGMGAVMESQARGLGVSCIADDLRALARAIVERSPC